MLDRLLSIFLGSQSTFSGIFMVFFYIFLLSKGDREPNGHEIEISNFVVLNVLKPDFCFSKIIRFSCGVHRDCTIM